VAWKRRTRADDEALEPDVDGKRQADDVERTDDDRPNEHPERQWRSKQVAERGELSAGLLERDW